MPRLDWVTCAGEGLEALECATAVVPLDYDRPKGRQITSDRAVARACAERGGPILDHMSTANVARDLDLLRRAVGDARLTYAGYSYGSYLGSTYANLFPGKVRALVVDGVLDPLAWSTGRGDQAPHPALLDPAGQRQGRVRDPQRVLPPLRRRRGGVRVLRGRPGPAVSPAGQAAVPRARPVPRRPGRHRRLRLRRAGRHHPRRAVRPGLQALRARLGGGLQQEDYPNFVEGFPGVACSATHNPSRVGSWSRAARAHDRRYPYFGRLWTWVSSLCEPWPGWDRDHYDGPWNRRTANPVPPRGTVCEPDVDPFAEGAAQTLQATGASSKADLIPPLLRRMLTD